MVRAGVTDQGWAEIAVRDSGDGMTAEDIRDALNAFKQVHRGLDRSFSGPGIGYAIAKTFTEMQGGRFYIKSQLGQGTLARITLPSPELASRLNDDAGTKQESTEAFVRSLRRTTKSLRRTNCCGRRCRNGHRRFFGEPVGWRCQFARS